MCIKTLIINMGNYNGGRAVNMDIKLKDIDAHYNEEYSHLRDEESIERKKSDIVVIIAFVIGFVLYLRGLCFRSLLLVAVGIIIMIVTVIVNTLINKYSAKHIRINNSISDIQIKAVEKTIDWYYSNREVNDFDRFKFINVYEQKYKNSIKYMIYDAPAKIVILLLSFLAYLIPMIIGDYSDATNNTQAYICIFVPFIVNQLIDKELLANILNNDSTKFSVITKIYYNHLMNN